MFGNLLKLIDELQQLLDYKIVGTNQISRVENLIKDAIEVISVIPTGGISNFDTFKEIWLKCGMNKYSEDELANYVKAINILNNSSIRVVEETIDKVDLFSMDDKTTYVLGNLADANISKDEAEILKKVGINNFVVVNREG
jgi:hypothetical protein